MNGKAEQSQQVEVDHAQVVCTCDQWCQWPFAMSCRGRRASAAIAPTPPTQPDPHPPETAPGRPPAACSASILPDLPAAPVLRATSGAAKIGSSTPRGEGEGLGSGAGQRNEAGTTDAGRGAALVRERHVTHGDFAKTAELATVLQDDFRTFARDDLPPAVRHGVEMIFVKLARIGCGDYGFDDHWDDIAGYAIGTRDSLPLKSEPLAETIRRS